MKSKSSRAPGSRHRDSAINSQLLKDKNRVNERVPEQRHNMTISIGMFDYEKAKKNILRKHSTLSKFPLNFQDP
ncbi:hypothetical protein L1887_04992 [Cichorium endivia]|nr:hypothetical protein L1887_04992 [Cichorium endivia]